MNLTLNDGALLSFGQALLDLVILILLLLGNRHHRFYAIYQRCVKP